jgi:hypothetical protein
MTPLYHAIFLGNSDAAQMITEAHVDDLSNCGPYGQNVLHIAALRSKGKTMHDEAQISTIQVCSHSKNCITPLNYLHITIYVNQTILEMSTQVIFELFSI